MSCPTATTTTSITTTTTTKPTTNTPSSMVQGMSFYLHYEQDDPGCLRLCSVRIRLALALNYGVDKKNIIFFEVFLGWLKGTQD